MCVYWRTHKLCTVTARGAAAAYIASRKVHFMDRPGTWVTGCYYFYYFDYIICCLVGQLPLWCTHLEQIFTWPDKPEMHIDTKAERRKNARMYFRERCANIDNSVAA